MFAPIAGMTGVTGFEPQAPANAALPVVKPDASHGNEIDRQTFAALMQPSEAIDGLPPVQASHGPSALSGLERFANLQKMEFQDNFQAMRDFSAAAPFLSMAESTAFGMELNMKISVASTQFKVASGVGKNTGKGIDTLMRNQ